MSDNAAFWNELAEKYSKSPVANPGAFERKIGLTRARLTPEHVILDVGCGTGSLALRLAPYAAHLHGLDLSSEMVRIARGKATAESAKNVTFHVGPFDDDVPYPPESFDGICAYSLLHLVSDRPAALKRILRLLKPGGFFVSSTVCLSDSWIPYAPILTIMRWLGKAPHVAMLRKRDLMAVLAEAGFSNITEPDVGAQATIAFVIAEKPR